MQATGNYFADLLAAREAGLVLSDLNPSKDELVALIERHNALVREYLEPVTKVESEPEIKPESNQYQDLFSQWQAKKEQPKAQSKTQSKKQRNQALKQMAAQIAAKPAPVAPVAPVAQPAPVPPVAEVAPTPGVTMIDKVPMVLTRNIEKNRLEIWFKGKPDRKVENDLQLNGFRWSLINQCWYALESEPALIAANTLARLFNAKELPVTPIPVTPVAQPTPVTPVANKIGMALTRNADKNGIEIRFDAKPDDDTLADLKLNGFRWSRFNQCWYAVESDLTLTVANALAGRFGVDGLPVKSVEITPSQPVETPKPEPVQPMQAAPSYIVIADHLYQTCLPVVETPRQQLANTLASIEIDKLSEKRVEQLLAVIKAVL